MRTFFGVLLWGANAIYAYRGYMREDYWMASFNLIAFLIVTWALLEQVRHEQA